MSHPSLDRLTASVHGFADPVVRSHLDACAECRASADRLREEAGAIARGLADADRLASLKEGLLRAAEAGPARRSGRGLFWQIPVAAAVLLSLVFVLLTPGPRHRLTSGRVALEDGREVSAPLEFAASRSWSIRAVDPASVRLSDRTTVDLIPGARLGLSPAGGRGVQPDLASGAASFTVAPASRMLTICTPAGRVEAAGGTFSMKIVTDENGGTPMKGMFAGALVTVFAGSISLSNPNGTAEAAPGQTVALARTQAPLLLTSPQDRQEDLLRRLENLAARVAKLEDEIVRLEARNQELKAQLAGNVSGVWSIGGSGGSFRVIQGGNTPGATVIIEEKKDK